MVHDQLFQLLIAAVIETLGEAFALVTKAGIDRAGYLEILINTLFAAPVTKPTAGDPLSPFAGK